MPYLFSASKLAFFHTSVPCSNPPADLVEVSDSVHESIMGDLLLRGKLLQADGDGGPLAGDRPEGGGVEAGVKDDPGAVPNSPQMDQAT